MLPKYHYEMFARTSETLKQTK